MASADTTPYSSAGLRLGSGPDNCAAVLQPMVRIGVTGHRDLADPAAARHLVAEVIGLVLRTLDTAIRPGGFLHVARPPVIPVGYQVISPLAEGADRVAADVVFCDGPDLSARARELVVPLPFPLDFYRGSDGQPGSDCSDAESQAEFDRLQSAACWTRPLSTSDPSDQQERDAGYHEVGKFVIAHSDVLLALWDGSRKQSKGGTAAIVRLALRSGVPVIWIPVTRRGRSEAGAPSDSITEPQLLIEDDADAVDGSPDESSHAPILQRAVDSSLVLTSPQAARVLSGRGRAPLPLPLLTLKRLKRTQELERSGEPRSAALSGTERPAASGDAGGTEPAGASARYTSQLLAYTAQWIEAPYARADGLAKKYQRRLRYLTIGVYAAAATAVALGAFAAVLFPYGGNWRLPVIFEALVLVALLIVQRMDLRTTWRDRWVEFRAMSEYMRVGRYLALVNPELSTALDFNRVARPASWSSEPRMAPWFAPVLERLWDRWPDVDPVRLDVKLLSCHLMREWIDDQIKYHKRRRDLHRRWDRNLGWALQVTLIATVLAVALHAIREYSPAFLGRTAGGRDLTTALLAFLTIALTSVAAAFNGYSGQQRHSFHHARFRRMATELVSIRGTIEHADTIDELRHSVERVRRITLGETTDWFEDMRDQLLDSPT
jgi:SMODS and SLOG-associating 2TM effector domain 1